MPPTGSSRSPRNGQEDEARIQIRLSLQARQAALSTAVARLLVENNESEEQTAQRVQDIYDRVQRQVYWLLSATLVAIVLTSLYLIRSNRRLFAELGSLSAQRSELVQRLIAARESTLHHISRELHDEFGQILTAMGADARTRRQTGAGRLAASRRAARSLRARPVDAQQRPQPVAGAAPVDPRRGRARERDRMVSADRREAGRRHHRLRASRIDAAGRTAPRRFTSTACCRKRSTTWPATRAPTARGCGCNTTPASSSWKSKITATGSARIRGAGWASSPCANGRSCWAEPSSSCGRPKAVRWCG